MGHLLMKHVSKSFKIYSDKSGTLKEKILFHSRNHYEEKKVLNDISLEVMEGEVVGLIGKNGCGKSTLLKLLSRIIYPDSGEIIVEGKVSSLLELGAGFHPDMTGLENIYINASILGLTKTEIDHRVKKIIEFSELQDYINQPIRIYSSGMYMRLAFSIAINVEAEILLVDEILTVGDAAFQKKCFNKLKELKGKGVTIVIVSHDLNSLKELCNKIYWLEDGRVYKFGTQVDTIINHYLNYMLGIKGSQKLMLEKCNTELILERWTAESIEGFSGMAGKEVNGSYSFRWMIERHSEIYLKRDKYDSESMLLKIKYMNNYPWEKGMIPIVLHVFLENMHVGSIACNRGINSIMFEVKRNLQDVTLDFFKIQLDVNLLWKPKELIDGSDDSRSLGIALISVEIL